MITGGRRAFLLLFAGDLVAFGVSLYLTLWLRYGAVPDSVLLAPYVIPFSLLFVLWILVFYSAGLYSKRLVLFPSRLSDALFKTQMANILFAALFFFFIPTFGIAPKTILALYLIVSLALIFAWRLGMYPRLSLRQNREQAVLLAHGAEADELFAEVNSNPRYGIEFCSRELGDERATTFVVDAASSDAGAINSLVRGGKQVVTFEDMYEEVFDRIPLSHLGHAWFRENVAATDPLFFTIAKRCIDIVGGLVMGFITIIATPFVALALQIEYPGSVFLAQTRIGQHGTRIRAYKFRSMRFGDRGAWKGEGANKVTRVGSFLRRVSLDEFPQFINVLKGELSLIGPRNDIEALGERLSDAIPYYLFRYSVRPGITGWAQINQQYEPGNVSPQSIEETKTRLAYDFYYLKHRSLGLDIIIALKTLKRMFFRLSSW
ncbi:MAG: sugar transferase [Candidatus Paceibacterota bacterium]|jgi:lipopolysaccharide/colanic/teichoic acid biosynthesis glycosyltransferase